MWLYLILAFVALLAYLYVTITKDYGFFAARGIKESPGYFPFGSKAMLKVR